MNRVLVLSTTTGYQLRSFNDAADRLGVELVFATDRCHQLDDPWRDRAIAVRFREEAAALDSILAAAAHTRFDGLIAVGDRPCVLAARAAERLGLPWNSPGEAAACSNKRESRVRLAAAGLRVPWYYSLPLSTDPLKAAAEPRLKFPCVLKPLGLSGSRGVIRANAPDEFVAAFRRIRVLLERVDVRAARTGHDDVLLIEGFIPGREVAVEGVLTRGEVTLFAIFDKPDPLDGPFFEETIYLTPSSLGARTQIRLASTIQLAVDALGLSHGPFHAECRIGPEGVVVLEIACRPIGGLCSKALRFRGGTPLEEVLLRHALGADVSGCARESLASAVMMIPIPRRGLLKAFAGEADARAVAHVEDVVITAKPDQLLEPLPEAGSYLGFIFARAESPAAAELAVRLAHTQLSFTIDPAIDVTLTR